MGREILIIQFGQAGVQIGSALWELFCIEHGLSADGHLVTLEGDVRHPELEHVNCLFYEGQKAWTPRSVMVDLEPTVIDEIRIGAYRQLWRPTSLVTGKEDAANNYGRGNCTIGKLKMEETLEAVRKMLEDTDNLAAFELVHSHSGGTGSGMTSLIIDQLCDEYGKKFKFGTSIFPSAMYSQSTVDPYNAMLLSHATIETLDCDILVDNQTLFDRCSKNLAIAQPSFSEINRLLAQMLSSLFLSHRFIYHGSQHADTTELLTNLIPYPRIHFPSLFYAPMVPKNYVDHDKMSVKELTRAVFSEDCQTIDFPCKQNAYISCAMLYRGIDSPKPVYDALKVVKGTPSVGASFVDWCPTGFKVGLNVYPPATVPRSPLAPAPRSICMLAGNLGMREAWHRNNMKFDVLFSRRCFVHWFIGEGIEESEFIEAREDMAYLEQDYAELMPEGSPDSPQQEIGNPDDQDRMQPKLEVSEVHILQENNANFLRSPKCPRGRQGQRNGDMECGDCYSITESSGHSGMVRCVNHGELPQLREENHSVVRSENGDDYNAFKMETNSMPCSVSHMYPAEKHGGDRAVISPRASTTQGPHNVFWPTGGEAIAEGRTSTGMLSNDSGMQTIDHNRTSLPRELNMNNARYSQASSDTAFLPTDPIVQEYGDFDCSELDYPAKVTDSQDSSWAHSGTRSTPYRHQSSHRSHHRRSHHRHHGSQSSSSEACHGVRSSSDCSLNSNHSVGVSRRSHLRKEKPRSTPNLLDTPVSPRNGELPRILEGPEHQVPNEVSLSSSEADSIVTQSMSSGLGSMSQEQSALSLAANMIDCEGERNYPTDYLPSSQGESGHAISNEIVHHRHHTRHRRHRHIHHHSRDNSGNLSHDSQPSQFEENLSHGNRRRPNEEGSVFLGSQNESLGQSPGRGLYLSMSKVAKRPIYEVSVSSSPEYDRAVTPVLSPWTPSKQPPTRTPIPNERVTNL
ncbi:unnamed protein product [Calicophoron daubneyi]|uniref:Tubulin/FtsZ GTPase domain-containing protein n=1 Tax=Calicophoron daubneyi TaxID=300641 RepID=A0AAV2TY41_CALDB